MNWLHIIADFSNIDFSELTESKLKNFLSEILRKHELTELGSHYHTFENDNEITAVIALAESHISLHTWPEFRYMSADIFVCNLHQNNTHKAEKIFDELKQFFKTEKVRMQKISRGK